MSDFEFLPGPRLPTSAYLRLDLRLLHGMLRLPLDVAIVSVRQDPSHAAGCILDLAGAVPRDGELGVAYTSFPTTIVQWNGWVLKP